MRSPSSVFRWTETPATLGDIELSQYHFISLTSGSLNTSVRDSTRSVVFLNFSFDRAIGFYVLQVYTPLVIIVMSSWVSFWLIKTEKGQETPARTGLGSTTVLAVVTIGFGFAGGGMLSCCKPVLVHTCTVSVQASPAPVAGSPPWTCTSCSASASCSSPSWSLPSSGQ